MKITILTIDSYNHGNRLQNYALTSVLEQISGLTVRTARIRHFSAIRNTLWFPLSYGKALLRSSRSLEDRRALKFLEFTHRYIPTIQVRPDQIVSNDDVVVVGSDQCWNPNWDLGARSDGLQCVIGKPANKKLSYAASFGIAEEAFSDTWKQRYGGWLKTFTSISVREDEAVSIVRNLSGIVAKWVLDPTMLLDKTNWQAIEKRPAGFSYRPREYCLKYVLGSEKDDAAIREYAQQEQISVYELLKTTPEVGPAEFLWLIHHAHSVVTDSFHGSVFSLLFHKRLFVLRRKDHLGDMSSRFETLKRFSGFEHCLVTDARCLGRQSDEMDWSCFESELAAFRRSSLAWLADALGRCI